MIHMLTGICTSRCFSFGSVGMSPTAGTGRTGPLEAQYNCLTCATATDDPTRHSTPSNAAAIPDSFHGISLERLGGKSILRSFA
jgi:hypothetical protein